MTIFCFVLDTSVSMNRIFDEKCSFLDSAKGAIEQMIKFDIKKDGQPSKFILATYDQKKPLKVRKLTNLGCDRP